MKTTKTIAAVLAVFLVAVLFMGAASAAAPTGVAYVYQNGVSTDPAGTLYYLWDGTTTTDMITVDGTGTFTSENIKEGVYSTTPAVLTAPFTVKYPTLSVSGYLLSSTGAITSTSIAGKTLAKSDWIKFVIDAPVGIDYGFTFTTPAGGKTNVFGKIAAADLSFANSLVATSGFLANAGAGIPLADVATGEWSVVASFKTGATPTSQLTVITPSKYLSSEKLTFKVGAIVTDAISLSTEKAVRGSSTLITLTGTPNSYVQVTVNAPGLILLPGQSGVVLAGNIPAWSGGAAVSQPDVPGTTVIGTSTYVDDFWVKLGATGTRTIELDSNTASDDKSYTITAKFSNAYTDLGVAIVGSDKNVKFTIIKGEVTGTSGQDSYYLGNDITISGTNTESDLIYLFIKGSNVDRTYFSTVVVDADHSWKTTFDPTVAYGPLDAGTYTFYASSNANPIVLPPFWEFDADFAYATVSVALKQPFLTATAESSVVAQNDKIKITGVAEATTDVRYYVFGNNKYVPGTISVDSDGTYSAEIPTATLSAGQYFVVIQHPMYDTIFNVADLTGTGVFYSNAFAAPALGDPVVVDVPTRQSANAAEALCQALDTQSIDDIYVKLTFVVAQPTITMNPVSDVTKGSALKVSGTTNLKEGTLVTVDVLSTAFTAMEKTSVNSASFITLTTKVVKGADGVNTWEVTFDTTGLNVDSYTVQAMTENLQTSAIVKVLEATPTATATATATKTATATATATATPTTTPGFGAFLALAGLGAVAVLVLRRD